MQVLWFIGYAFECRHEDAIEETGCDIVLQAFRSVAFLGDWTRVLIHALFLNGVDEMDSMHVFTGEEAVPTWDDGGASGRGTAIETLELSRAR